MSEVKIDVGLFDIQSLPFIMLRESIISPSLIITLSDYENKQQVVLKDMDMDGFLRGLRTYKPYGFINEMHYSEAKYGYPVVVIDRFSWKFLDYVDDVVVRFRQPEESSFPIILSDYFEAADAEYTIFRNSDYFDKYCTLFNAVFSNLGVFSGDGDLMTTTASSGIYLLHGIMEAGDSFSPYPVVYSIHINDLKAVHILMSKAAMAGMKTLPAYENYC